MAKNTDIFKSGMGRKWEGGGGVVKVDLFMPGDFFLTN